MHFIVVCNTTYTCTFCMMFVLYIICILLVSCVFPVNNVDIVCILSVLLERHQRPESNSLCVLTYLANKCDSDSDFCMANLFRQSSLSLVHTNGLNYSEGFFSSLGFSLSEACKLLQSRSLFLIRR